MITSSSGSSSESSSGSSPGSSSGSPRPPPLLLTPVAPRFNVNDVVFLLMPVSGSAQEVCGYIERINTDGTYTVVYFEPKKSIYGTVDYTSYTAQNVDERRLKMYALYAVNDKVMIFDLQRSTWSDATIRSVMTGMTTIDASQLKMPSVYTAHVDGTSEKTFWGQPNTLKVSPAQVTRMFTQSGQGVMLVPPSDVMYVV